MVVRQYFCGTQAVNNVAKTWLSNEKYQLFVICHPQTTLVFRNLECLGINCFNPGALSFSVPTS